MSEKLQLFTFKPLPHEMSNGNKVFIRRMSGAERLEWVLHSMDLIEKAKSNERGNLEYSHKDRAKLVCIALGNEDGSRYFKDDELPSVEQIDHFLLDELAEVSAEVNCLWGKNNNEAAKKK